MKPHIGRQTHVALPTLLEFSWGHAKDTDSVIYSILTPWQMKRESTRVSQQTGQGSGLKFFQFRLKAGVRTGILRLQHECVCKPYRFISRNQGTHWPTERWNDDRLERRYARQSQRSAMALAKGSRIIGTTNSSTTEVPVFTTRSKVCRNPCSPERTP